MAFHFKQGFCIFRVDDTIQPLTEDEAITFRRCWLYPASAAAGGKLVANQNDCFVGKRGAGEPMTPDTLTPANISQPELIEVLASDPPMKLSLLIAQGKAGDGIFFSCT